MFTFIYWTFPCCWLDNSKVIFCSFVVCWKGLIQYNSCKNKEKGGLCVVKKNLRCQNKSMQVIPLRETDDFRIPWSKSFSKTCKNRRNCSLPKSVSNSIPLSNLRFVNKRGINSKIDFKIKIEAFFPLCLCKKKSPFQYKFSGYIQNRMRISTIPLLDWTLLFYRCAHSHWLNIPNLA